ncbi:inter-alpha-trypsin inhibitor heavy chain H5-like, partial [Saccostrea cucullata]|uniref:inter-alpha-trypsin inhibitor heavy chain H5-like n=1 Tax=Saccostrea cuccullata TaxID=36930 RepID=UPI002ECFD9ED
MDHMTFLNSEFSNGYLNNNKYRIGGQWSTEAGEWRWINGNAVFDSVNLNLTDFDISSNNGDLMWDSDSNLRQINTGNGEKYLCLQKCETSNIPETDIHYWNVTYSLTDLIDIMESNAQIHYVNKQILAMEDGTMMVYPFPPSGISSEVVKHYSQLYASTLSPVEKDLVIVIDRSGSLADVHGTKTLLQITIEAVTFVLETLTANDRIGIVVFDTGTVVPGAASRKCVGTKLAKATPENVKFLQSILQNIQIGARTNYELALREAFKFFKHSNYTTESEQREKIILFLTDGLPTVGKDPVKTIAEENKILNNSVAIFTYGIGQLLNDTIVDVLQKMTGQVESDPKYGIVRKGEFKKIANPSKLQDILASYWKP